MKMEAVAGSADLVVLHVRRKSGTRVVPCRMVLRMPEGLVEEETCQEQAGGSLVPSTHTQVSLDQEARRLRLFAEEAPCWFDGCEELRKQYLGDIARMDDNCLPCEQGRIMRRYLDYMASLGV